MMQKEWYIGTSGWYYPHWKNVFYPKSLKQKDWFNYYCQYFNAVEVNMTFYRVPSLKQVENWVQISRKDFKFVVKLNKKISHLKRFEDCKDELLQFLNSILPLKDKLLAILIQLPPSMKYEPKLGRNVLNSIEQIKKFFPQSFIALEIRNKTWLMESVVKIFDPDIIPLVFSHSNGRYPEIFRPRSFFYARLHGPGSLYASQYDEHFLNQFYLKLVLEEQIKTVVVFFNNDYNGFAVKNALYFQSLIQKEEEG